MGDSTEPTHVVLITGELCRYYITSVISFTRKTFEICTCGHRS